MASRTTEPNEREDAVSVEENSGRGGYHRDTTHQILGVARSNANVVSHEGYQEDNLIRGNTITKGLRDQPVPHG